MSDDEDDVVVMQVCHRKGCSEMNDLAMDEESGELYCAACRELFARAASEGFGILINDDDRAVIRLIFEAFDGDRKQYWSFEDYNRFLEATAELHRDGGELRFDDPEGMAEHFKSEFDLDLGSVGGAAVVIGEDLENMYGGYSYNGIDALRDDSELLEEHGFIRTAHLE